MPSGRGRWEALAVEPDDPAAPWLVDLLTRRERYLRAWIPLARVDAPDAVHKLRVGLRQLRSDVRTFAPLLEASVGAGVDAELKRLGERLGAARDAEVLKTRWQRLGAALQLPLGASGALVALLTYLDERHAVARVDLEEAMVAGQFEVLVAGVARLRHSLTVGPSSTIAGSVRPCVAAAASRFVRRGDRALTAPEPGRADQLHAARRAAKRARYAVEAVVDVFGGPARLLAARLETVQDQLGEAQDARVSRELLLDRARAAEASGWDPSLARLLAGQEDKGHAAAVEQFEAGWPEVRRRSHRRWLRD